MLPLMLALLTLLLLLALWCLCGTGRGVGGGVLGVTLVHTLYKSQQWDVSARLVT
jgi:hypothetical protein